MLPFPGGDLVELVGEGAPEDLVEVVQVSALDEAMGAIGDNNADAVFVPYPAPIKWLPTLSACADEALLIWIADGSSMVAAYDACMNNGSGMGHGVVDRDGLGAKSLHRACLAALHARRLQERLHESSAFQNAAREQERLAKFVIENSSAVLFRWLPSSGSPVAYVSENVRIFGYTSEEMLQPTFFYQSIIHPEDLEFNLRQIKEYRERGVDRFFLSYRVLTRDGDIRWVDDSTYVERDASGAVLWHQGIVVDVTVRREAQEQLVKLSQAVEQSPGSVVIADPRGRIEYVNAKFSVVSGYERDEVVGSQMIGFNADGDGASRKSLWDAIWHGTEWRGEVRKRRRDGEPYWELVSGSPIRNASGNITHYLEVGEDITERRRVEAMMRQMAFYDALTGLPNRTLFNDRLSHALPRAKRDQQPLSVLFLDLDNFKSVNDTLGHAAGDSLLKQVAERLSSSVRAGDTVARLAGDEFMVLLSSLNRASHSSQVAEKIIDAFQRPFLVDGVARVVTTSIGISTFPIDGETAEALMKSADAAMYRAKDLGRSGYCYATPPDDDGSFRRLTLQDLLVQALVRDELELLFHPVFDLQTKRVVAFEALLRWNHPERGVLPPTEFLSLADGAGIVSELDRWVIRRASLAALQWAQAGQPDTRVSCNVTAKQLAAPGFASRAIEVIDAHKLAPQRLELELAAVEAFVLDEAARDAITDLRAYGIRIAIGDNGDGDWERRWASAPDADTLKIERSLVRHVEDREQCEQTIGGLIAAARGFGLTVIAEGVETVGQASRLRALGCGLAQGFAFALPLHEHESVALLVSRSEPSKSDG